MAPNAEYFVVRHLGGSAPSPGADRPVLCAADDWSVLAVSVFGDWLRDGWANAVIAAPVQFALDM